MLHNLTSLLIILLAVLIYHFSRSISRPFPFRFPIPCHPVMTTPNKRGLCWPVENTSSTVPFTRPGSKVSWLYNWSPNATPSSTIPFIPMQWNHVETENLAQKLPPSTTHILAFNEPERPDQANMSASTAASLWLTHIEPLRKRPTNPIRAGSPGISSCEEGIAWLQEFVKLIRAGGSDVDFWALHWYGEGLGPFYDFIWSTHHRLDPKIPVWITEFACTNWRAEEPLGREVVEGFLRESVRYLDGLDWVERYAWFGPMRDTGTVGKWAALLDESGEINDLGKIYRDL